MAKITCTKCKLEKEDIDFHRSKTIKRGYTFRCKQCLSEDVKEKAFTPEGRAKRIWHNMRWRCENKDGRHPQYAHIKLLMTKEEWMEWAVPRYAAWKGDNPTVDRIDPDGHYEIDNIQLLEYKENMKKVRYDKAKTPYTVARIAMGLCLAYKFDPEEVIANMRKLFNR